ncbi:MAG: 50S ribosomal protein L4 [Elusimicrobiota bacterium]|jgi:large subunit ribosomal protein L4|nr:50S ribosomal protein L4 [Elusimicrobiota bacterium]
MDTTVFNIKGQEQGKIDLPDFFLTKVSPALLHEVTTAFLTNQRAGTHSSKSRGEVAFSGAKPWKQKGTGNARAGQRNSPLWRKGGVAFGPKPKDYYVKISKQKKQAALNMAIAEQFQNGNIIVVDSLKLDEPKTKKVCEMLKNLKLNGRKIVFAISPDPVFKLASRNIEEVFVENVKNINAYQVLWADKIVLTSESLDLLKNRLAN